MQNVVDYIVDKVYQLTHMEPEVFFQQNEATISWSYHEISLQYRYRHYYLQYEDLRSEEITYYNNIQHAIEDVVDYLFAQLYPRRML